MFAFIRNVQQTFLLIQDNTNKNLILSTLMSCNQSKKISVILL